MHANLMRSAGFRFDFKIAEFDPLGLWPLPLRRARGIPPLLVEEGLWGGDLKSF